MPLNYINHWNDIFDKLENVIATEFGNALPVFIGDDSVGKGSQYIRIEPVNNTLLEYHSHGQIREYTANIFIYFKEKKVDERVLESILNVSARLERLIFNNINMTTDYADNIYDCRLDSVELNTEPENEEYYVISAEWSGTLNSVDTLRTSDTYSVLFDGDNDFMSIPTTPTLEVFSTTVWLKVTDVTGLRGVFEGAGVFANPSSIYQTSGKFSVHNGSGWTQGANNLADGNWKFIVFTFAKNGSAGDYTAYVNGEGAGGGFPATGVGTRTNGNLTRIGIDASSLTYDFKGHVSSVALYNKVLSQSEARSLYNNGVPVNLLSHSTASNLQHWWKMGDGTESGSGTTVYDMKGGTDYNGTLSGDASYETGVTV